VPNQQCQSSEGIKNTALLSGEVLAMLSVWIEVQMICIWFSWCHCHPIISCSSKIQNGLHLWWQLNCNINMKALLSSGSLLLLDLDFASKVNCYQ